MATSLRIAASVFFGLLTLALFGYWVDSYNGGVEGDFALVGQQNLRVASSSGLVDFAIYGNSAPHVALGYRGDIFWPWHNGTMGFDHTAGFLYTTATIPYWFMTGASLALSLLLGFKRLWRFSIRGLLIAMAILAAMLGLAIYATT